MQKPTSVRGPRDRTIPANAVHILPDTDIKSIIAQHKPGTIFVFRHGLHRLLEPIFPQEGMVFLAESKETKVSGARLLTSWVKDGSANRWITSGQTQGDGQGHGTCLPGYPRCGVPQDVFIDNIPQIAVASASAVTSGKFFFDYAADKIWIGDNPAGRIVETSVVAEAFGGVAADVTLEDLIVEKFACRAQLSAIMGGDGWRLNNLEVTRNHGGGVEVRNRRIVNSCHIHTNGQLGIRGSGADVDVDNCEIDHNNYAFYDPGWEAGGSKFAYCKRIKVRNSYFHWNRGPGCWFDINNDAMEIYQNQSDDNFSPGNSCAPGIFIEISYGGKCYDNLCQRNGKGFSPWLWGCGIIVAASGGTGLDLYDNWLLDNEGGIGLIQQNRVGGEDQGPYLVQNVNVHDNYVRTKGLHGAAQDVNNNAIFNSRNNKFLRNVYEGMTGNNFAWMNADGDFARWKSFGLDPVPGGIKADGTGGITPYPTVTPIPPNPEPGVPIVTTLTGNVTLKITTLEGVPKKVEVSGILE